MDETQGRGTVKTWYPEEGWGSIEIEGVAGDCFAHFSCIVQKEHEFAELVPGEQVLVNWHKAQQDDFPIVADRVERSWQSRPEAPGPVAAAYASELLP